MHQAPTHVTILINELLHYCTVTRRRHIGVYCSWLGVVDILGVIVHPVPTDIRYVIQALRKKMWFPVLINIWNKNIDFFVEGVTWMSKSIFIMRWDFGYTPLSNLHSYNTTMYKIRIDKPKGHRMINITFGFHFIYSRITSMLFSHIYRHYVPR